MRFRLEMRVRQASLARSVVRLKRPNALADSQNQWCVPMGATLSIELDKGFDRNAVHVDDEAITASIMIHDIHREALQGGPVERADHILLEILLCCSDVTSASVRIASIPKEIREIQQRTISKRVMNQRREAIVFVSGPAVGSVGPLACTLRIAETQCVLEPIVVPGTLVELDQALNHSFLRPWCVMNCDQSLQVAAVNDGTVHTAVCDYPAGQPPP